MRRQKGQPRYTGSIFNFKFSRPRKLHPVLQLKGSICVQKKDAQFPHVSS